MAEADWRKMSTGKFWYDEPDYPCNFWESLFNSTHGAKPDGSIEIIFCNPDLEGVAQPGPAPKWSTGEQKACQIDLFPSVNTVPKRSRKSK